MYIGFTVYSIFVIVFFSNHFLSQFDILYFVYIHRFFKIVPFSVKRVWSTKQVSSVLNRQREETEEEHTCSVPETRFKETKKS